MTCSNLRAAVGQIEPALNNVLALAGAAPADVKAAVEGAASSVRRTVDLAQGAVSALKTVRVTWRSC